jgi:hypothetical protein
VISVWSVPRSNMLLLSSGFKYVGPGIGSVIGGGYKEGCHNTQGEVMSEPITFRPKAPETARSSEGQ